MLERIVTMTTITITGNSDGFGVIVATRYCESTITGGGMRTHVDTYTRLSRHELTDLVEHLADAPVAGEAWRGAGLQLSLI